MSTRAPAAAREPLPLPLRPAQRLLAAPHRLFFLAGVAQIALASLWWLWVLAARVAPGLPAPAAPVPDTVLHALLMTCGFAPFFMFGFMFTAGPRWLSVLPPPPGAWRTPALVAAAGAFALVPLQVAGIGGLRIAAAVYALAWLWLLLRFVLLIRKSTAPDKVHAKLVAAGLAVGASCVAAFAAFGTAAHPWISSAGVWGFLLPVFVTVCHRMIPFFTSGVVPFVTAFRPWWLLALMVGAPLLHATIAGVGRADWTWVVDLPAAGALLLVTLRWGFVQSMRNRLLAMLHLGFVWYGTGFLLAGVGSLLALTRRHRPGARAAARDDDRLRVVAAARDGHPRHVRTLRPHAGRGCAHVAPVPVAAGRGGAARRRRTRGERVVDARRRRVLGGVHGAVVREVRARLLAAARGRAAGLGGWRGWSRSVPSLPAASREAGTHGVVASSEAGFPLRGNDVAGSVTHFGSR